ncbi:MULTISPECIES: DEAD/DEAH box helicase [unclassified Vibrio]|uniref:DEAD/DEAH box helicase n=1 Tax=unclassified Vibrio TaxID=2614977 RepID=UPI0014831244|nr:MULTISPECIES: DEAD/DEAH box helicase [unclassified Vibrio]MDQ2189555.1 DEAD/DEAH box helicase [Vibrio sp. A14(2019)]MDQ2195153.1 DEAD/DEAH box helicase [Vibrio sp. 2017_1457_11]NNN74238.1 DEAD/DEAH box helicase [Vibrio sp. B7]NNN91333.1 DEAD/DEAH box helicase [Vibrio sp. B8-1]NNO06194.1 DEAD/DEAH box helicase [Vibrio sp. B4-12]
MYTLRPYQSDSVKAVIHYFRYHTTPAVIVLPTGAGKSLVIAELARLAKGRVLVLAHVKELVEQNHAKYEGYGLQGAVFAAGLGRKETDQQVVFASVQSVVRNLDAFKNQFSLLVIDECHRVPDEKSSSYQKVITHLSELNPGIKVLGLTATPYRLGMGWIYQYHTRGQVRSEEPRFFRDCIFELPIRYLLDEAFLTPARMVDAPVLSYDFSQLKPANTGRYKEAELDMVIEQSKRATPQIVQQIIQLAQQKQGVMIFAATVRHAQEIVQLLPNNETAIVIGDTPPPERDTIIKQFKQRQIKFLVNVSVLTTGFDAPHVDLIAILRPTESISLYQQIVGRGLRLSAGKTECLVLDYAGNNYDLYQPEVGEPKPDPNSEIITIPCPACGFNNNFWGKLDAAGFLLEHYGRRCQGYFTDEESGEREHCGYRFRAKYCGECGADNDIAARICHECDTTLVDPDKKLKEALNLKDALVFECIEMDLNVHKDASGKAQLRVTYRGENDAQVHEFWPLTTKKQKQVFHDQFVRPHLADKHRPFDQSSPSKVVAHQHRFRPPQFVIARKVRRFWKMRDKIFEDELQNR